MKNPAPSSPRSWLVVALASSVLALAPEAHAKCGPPAPVMAPASGSVPARPVLELLVPDWGTYEGQHAPPHVVAKDASGAAPAVTVKADTVAPGLKSFRVAIAAAQAGALAVDLVDDNGKTVRSWSFVVDPRWKAPASSLATVGMHAVDKSWTCSHTHTQNLTFDGAAAAYRVVAAASAADFAAGRTRSFVLPRTMAAFWEYGSPSASPASPAPVDLELGFADCFGETVDWPSGAGLAQVFAVLPDGREQRVTDKPIRVVQP